MKRLNISSWRFIPSVFFWQEQVLGLVIEVQNEVLNEIFEDLNAETIIPCLHKDLS